MYDPCKHCQYRNGYWSIISPCESCPHNDTITTTTENAETLTIKSNCEITNNVFITGLTVELPSSEEYANMHQSVFYEQRKWSEPKYKCPKCGGGMCRNEMVVLTSNPPKFEYRCNKCGNVEYQYG